MGWRVEVVVRSFRYSVLLLLLASPLGGCLEGAVYPRNHEPTAFEDSICPHVRPALGEVINYGCATGRRIARAARPKVIVEANRVSPI
jgi:hypothetical protein